MRKVLLFLAIFGVGLAALLLLKGRFRRPSPSAPTKNPPVADSQFTKVPAPVEGPGKSTSPIEIHQRGAVDITQFEEQGGAVKRPIRTLKAKDSNSLGGNVYVLVDMVAEELDPKTGETKLRLTSPRTRLRLAVVDGKLQIGELDRAALTDVEGTVFGHSAISPLKIQVPLLEWRIAERRWVSDSHVTITGAESSLVASGDGLDADLESGTVILQRSGTIDLKLAGGRTATLAATGTGPIQFKDVKEGDVDEVWITASDGARLSFVGEELSRLDAEKILIKTRSAETGEKKLELVSVDAEGKVVADSRGDRFRADKARFLPTPAGKVSHADLEGSVSLESVEGNLKGERATFDFAPDGPLEKAHVEGGVEIVRGEDHFHSDAADFRFSPDGRLATADLVGSPEGTISIGRYLPPGERELRAARPQISGQGPMHVDLASGTKLTVQGPGKIVAPEVGLEITASRSLEGSASTDGRTGDFAALGGATVKWRDDDLACDEVRIEVRPDDAGGTIATTHGIGSTTMHRKTEDGSTLTMIAAKGLDAITKPGHTIVERADDVSITATGTAPFTATAQHVEHFDWEAQSFTAAGDVKLDGSQGRGSAERVVARGKNDLELEGVPAAENVPAKPARYARSAGAGATKFEEAGIEGLSIRATDTSLDATGNVRLDVAGAAETYHLQGGEVHVTFEPPESAEPGAPRPFEAHAKTGVRAEIDSARGASTVSSDTLRVRGTTKGELGAHATPKVLEPDVRAEGSVVVDWKGEGGLTGSGDLFTMDPEGRGQLTADPGKRVHARGHRVGDVLPYVMVADWIEFEKERLEARNVEMRLDVPVIGAAALAGKPYVSAMTADHLLVTPIQALLEGHAHAEGRTSKAEEWTLDAGSVKLIGNFALAKDGKPPEIESIEAWDGIKAKVGQRASASGRSLDGRNGKIKLEGTKEDPARVEFGPMGMSSPWIEYDVENMLVATEQGEIHPTDDKTPWSIEYESLQPFLREDKSILAMRNPVYKSGEDEVRALWLLCWLDREEWKRNGRKAITESSKAPELHAETPEIPAETAAKNKAKPDPEARKKERLAKLRSDIAKFRAGPVSKILSEVYVEGNVELTRKGERTARATSVYFDLVDGRGWARDADVLQEVDIRGHLQQLRVSAEWMRINADFSMRADKATLTFCGYDKPHYVVETGDLRMRPNGAGDDLFDFDVSATNNALRFENGWAIPLPPILWARDEEGNPIIENLAVGKSAKFGASIGAGFNVGLGTIGNGLGGLFAGLLSLPKPSIKGHWRFHADYLGTRGLLLGTGLEMHSGDQFHLESELSIIPDRGEDRGLVRVPQDERSLIRSWFRTRARYSPSKSEWFDLALSIQSDPGVQAEFFETDYIRYEQKDNYIHWRKASDEWFFNASVKVLLEDRTDVEELPKVGVFRARTPIGELFGLDLLYTGYVDAGYFRRHNGDPEFYPPFPDMRGPDGFYTPDGFGDRDVARIDTDHKVEAPFSFGFAGLRGTPWGEVRATAWNEGQDPDTSPSRAAAIAGFDLSTTFWRRYGHYMNTVTPFASVHGDFASEESDGQPVPFDMTEIPVEGKFVDLGLRTRVWDPKTQNHFDAEVRATHGSDLPNGLPDGMQPIQVLGELLTTVGSVPVGISHDGRYDVEHGSTVYSRTYFGFRPVRQWDIELGYHRGIDPSGNLLFEATSGAMRYRATDKWEIQLGETISQLDDKALATNLILRRIGHDFVTEVQVGFTAGEGQSVSINMTPLITWKPSNLGLLDHWLGR
jgi:hypothetical protein